MSLSPMRKGRFTASSHAVALGHGYQSPQAFWRHWHGMEDFDEQAKSRMAWGTNHEVDAIQAYEELTGDIVCGCLDRQIFFPFEEWSGCTPDGFTTLGLVDGKCPQKMYDTPPNQYWIQLQSQMFFTGTSIADLIAWTPEESRIWRTTAASEYWTQVGPILKSYWQVLIGGLEPKRGQFKKINLPFQWERIA